VTVTRGTDEEIDDTEAQVARASARQRLLAWLALLASVGAVVALVVLVVTQHGASLLAVVVGVAVGASGAWWTIAHRGVRRTIGVVAVVVGVGLCVAALVWAASEPDSFAIEVAVLLAVTALAYGAARSALRHDARELAAAETRATPPRHPVLLCNPWSGGGKVEKFGLVELAESLGVETVLLDHGLDLEQLARDAVARGADCLGMAGGDGSQALVASIAVEHGLPFVCVSAGTRNHFALDLGIDREDPRHSVRAFRDAVERHIDYATVNDRFFVNNVSLGVYATIVQQDEYRDDKVGTTTTLLPEMLGAADSPFDLQFTEPDGSEVDGAFLIQVSNNPYVLGPSLDVAQRRRMDTGTLGVFAVTGSTGAEAAGVVTLGALGQRRLSPNWHEFTSTGFEVRSRSGTAYAGIDGEALELPTPLRFAIHPGGLRLLVPAGNSVLADQRRARDVTLGDLVTLARGIDPAPVGAAGEGADR